MGKHAHSGSVGESPARLISPPRANSCAGGRVEQEGKGMFHDRTRRTGNRCFHRCHKASLLLTTTFLLAILLCGCRGDPLCADPPASLRESDLVGVWEARYERNSRYDPYSRDLLSLANGVYVQMYTERFRLSEYSHYVSPRFEYEWWVERFPDGRVRVHLAEGRFYDGGILVNDWPEWSSRTYWDPVAEESVFADHELILNVRVCNGELVLVHLRTDTEDLHSGVFHRHQ